MNSNEGKEQNKKIDISTIATGILLTIVVFLFILVIIDDFDKQSGNESGNESGNDNVAHISVSPLINTPSPTDNLYTSGSPIVTSPSITANPTEKPLEPYTYGLPVYEKLPAVDMNYFKDAIFIGDSRMRDFVFHNELFKYAGFYADISLNVGSFIPVPGIQLHKFKVGGEQLTFLEAIAKKNTFKKAYVMLGFNELGWPGTASFKQYYTRLLNEIRKVNPDVVIYVYSVIPVARTVKDEDPKFVNNTRIAEYNSMLKEICKEGQFHYLNVQEVLIDSEGYLPDDASNDGAHPNKNYCMKWLEYTKTHTI